MFGTATAPSSVSGSAIGLSPLKKSSHVLFSLGSSFPSSSTLLSDLDDGWEVNEEEIEDIEVTAKGCFGTRSSVWVSTDFFLTVLIDFLTIFLRSFSALTFSALRIALSSFKLLMVSWQFSKFLVRL